MVILLTSVLILCLLAVVHTYLLYPWWMRKGARSPDVLRSCLRRSAALRRDHELHLGHARPSEKAFMPSIVEVQVQGKFSERKVEDNENDALPPVFVLMAAHNEEAVLEAKLATLASQQYAGPLVFLIGSDCSTDRTNDILTTRASTDPRFRPTLFTTRQGKPGIINQLAASAGSAGIFVLTDASVMLRPDTIAELVRPMLENPAIGVVDATMVQTGGRAAGIGRSEESYINREVAVKRAEGERWGCMIGPFGGCWAIRAEAYRPVPANFLVDDFYLCMAAYEAGWHGVSSARAIVEESVGQSIRDEFRRKVRISSGNWQNLVRFRKLWWPPTKNPLAFAFFSHKVLRWWTPLFMLVGTVCTLLLAVTLSNHWAFPLLILLLGLVPGLALTDLLLETIGLHLRPLRSLRYFLAMNAALLVGFYRYLTGIKTNVWQPSQRH